MLGIYVHIPFCVKKCNYCDFTSYPALIGRSKEYIDALCKEISVYSADTVNTIYFGGGTPSLLDANQLTKVMSALKNRFDVLPGAEITIEVNPCTLDAEKAKAIKDAGFNRISLGSQTFIDSELQSLGRAHSADDTLASLELLRKTGFKNISLDLMYAIPGQSFDTLSTSINQVLKLSPEHISCYGLKIEEGTPFYDMLTKGAIAEKSDDEYADMYEMILSKLKSAGYTQYELSNFSKKGFESKHNIKYWQCEDYIGIGLGASSCLNAVRSTHTSDFQKYIRSFENAECERLSDGERMSEFMILSLRLTHLGANKEDFKKRFGKSIEEVFGTSLRKHLANGMINELSDRYILSEKAYYISNSVLCDFI